MQGFYFIFFAVTHLVCQPFIWKSLTWYLYLRKDVANNIFCVISSFLFYWSSTIILMWAELYRHYESGSKLIIVLYFSRYKKVSQTTKDWSFVCRKKTKQKTISYLYNPQGENIRWKRENILHLFKLT